MYAISALFFCKAFSYLWNKRKKNEKQQQQKKPDYPVRVKQYNLMWSFYMCEHYALCIWMNWKETAENPSFKYACQIQVDFTNTSSHLQDLDLCMLWNEKAKVINVKQTRFLKESYFDSF